MFQKLLFYLFLLPGFLLFIGEDYSMMAYAALDSV